MKEEEGIREGRVNGVKTCAVPIWKELGVGRVRKDEKEYVIVFEFHTHSR